MTGANREYLIDVTCLFLFNSTYNRSERILRSVKITDKSLCNPFSYVCINKHADLKIDVVAYTYNY